MKKLILLTSILFSFGIANAQKGDFTFSVGTTSNPMSRALSQSDLTVKNSSVPLHFEAGYFLTKKLQFSLAYNTSSANSSDEIVSGSKKYQLDFDGSATSLMLRTNFFYVNKKQFQLGSGLAMGLVRVSATAKLSPNDIEIPISLDENGFGIHFNLLEARYNFSEHFGAYGNIGFQDQGLYGLGVIARF